MVMLDIEGSLFAWVSVPGCHCCHRAPGAAVPSVLAPSKPLCPVLARDGGFPFLCLISCLSWVMNPTALQMCPELGTANKMGCDGLPTQLSWHKLELFPVSFTYFLFCLFP